MRNDYSFSKRVDSLELFNSLMSASFLSRFRKVAVILCLAWSLS